MYGGRGYPRRFVGYPSPPKLSSGTTGSLDMASSQGTKTEGNLEQAEKIIAHSKLSSGTTGSLDMASSLGTKTEGNLEQAEKIIAHSKLSSSTTGSLDMASSPGTNTEGNLEQAEKIIAHSKKLLDDVHEIGLRIKHFEDNVNYLKTLKNTLDESVSDMQVVLGKYDRASFVKTKEDDAAHVMSEEETIGNILKHENSAAAILCGMKTQGKALSSDHSLTKDVIGIVATLGKVDDDNLSRLLSEYLGLDTMLAVVCKTYEGVKALESYDREGSIIKSFGLHAFATSTGRLLAGRFIVICLEYIRPYAGECMSDDPQRRLSLLKPKLPNGEIPPGFLGFAVNMITIDIANLWCTTNGHSLRDTLFYHLFSNLQVYKSREEMFKALPCIRNGAISLDGGMIRSPGVFTLGHHHHQGGFGVKFPRGAAMLNIPESFLEMENDLKFKKWKRDRAVDDLHRERALLSHAKFMYEQKKQEYLQYLVESQNQVGQGSTSGSHQQHQVGRGSTSRLHQQHQVGQGLTSILHQQHQVGRGRGRGRGSTSR